MFFVGMDIDELENRKSDLEDEETRLDIALEDAEFDFGEDSEEALTLRDELDEVKAQIAEIEDEIGRQNYEDRMSIMRASRYW